MSSLSCLISRSFLPQRCRWNDSCLEWAGLHFYDLTWVIELVGSICLQTMLFLKFGILCFGVASGIIDEAVDLTAWIALEPPSSLTCRAWGCLWSLGAYMHHVWEVHLLVIAKATALVSRDRFRQCCVLLWKELIAGANLIVSCLRIQIRLFITVED